jgi:hypothetical protein
VAQRQIDPGRAVEVAQTIRHAEHRAELQADGTVIARAPGESPADPPEGFVLHEAVGSEMNEAIAA